MQKTTSIYGQNNITGKQVIFLPYKAEVAKNIAEKIEVIISPEVQKSIEQIPTENLEAYDVFLKGIDLLNKGLTENAS